MLANAFGVPTIAVDTHVFRVSNRLGLADANTVEKTERQLMEVAQKDWIITHHRLIHHGRRLCKARVPAPSVLNALCPHDQRTQMFSHY